MESFRWGFSGLGALMEADGALALQKSQQLPFPRSAYVAGRS